MEQKGIATFPKPVYHRIPNFIGAERAAQILRNLPEYKKAKVIFCNPDSPQRPVREMTLKDGKILVMATPRLKHGFLVIAPETTTGKERFASTIKGAFKYGKETTNFLDAEETAQKLVEALSKLQTEATSYQTAAKELNDVKLELLNLIESTKNGVERSQDIIKLIGEIGGPEIIDRLVRLEEKLTHLNTKIISYLLSS